MLRELGAILHKNKDKIFDDLPNGVNATALIKKATFEIKNNYALLKCKPESLFWAIYESAVNGLEIGGIRSEAYLVPYGQEVKLIPSYKGLISLVRRTGKLVDVTMECVHQGDQFSVERGDNVSLRHVPANDDARLERPVTHVYVIFHMRDGSKIRNVKTSSEINAHRDAYSEAYKRGEEYRLKQEAAKQPIDPKKLSPWHNHWQVMAFKTLIRDAINRGRLPLSEAHMEIVNREDPVDVIDATPKPAIEQQGDEFDEIVADLGGVPELPSPDDDEADGDTVAADPAWFSGIGCEVLKDKLAACQNLGQVTAVQDEAYQQCQDDDERAYVRDNANDRAKQIRESRSKK